MPPVDALREEWSERAMSHSVQRVMTITEEGLVLGAGTVLAKMEHRRGRAPELVLDGAEERILALLAAAYGRPIEATVIDNIRRASDYCGEGEVCLALIQLVLSGLPQLEDETASPRLFVAEKLLDAGLAPRDLMKVLEIDPVPLDMLKAGFDPNQARVPAGNGRGSGRWGNGNLSPAAAQNRPSGGEYRPGDPDGFFDTLYPQVSALAQTLGIDESWLLGLGAYESYWLGPHDRRLNNPFGVTHGGGRNVGYGSIGAAVDYWERRYGPVVRGATSPEDFAQRLWDAGYNKKNPHWRRDLVRTIRSVPRRLKDWKSRGGAR
jgi:hypothetical protein